MILKITLAAAAILFWVSQIDFNDSKAPIRSLTLGDVNFLHTTDTHGWYSGHLNQNTYSANWGDFVSFALHMRKLANENGKDLLLVDSGDRHDGNGLSDITSPNGAKSSTIFMNQHYDIVTLGNHELYLWENSQQEAELVAPYYGEKYVCSNVEYLKDGNWSLFGQRFRYFETAVQKTRILAFSFLFDFNRNNQNTRVTPIAKAIHEDWFRDVVEEYKDKVDMVVVVGHVPVDRRWNELSVLHGELRTHFPLTKIQYFGGHSHIRDFVLYDENLTGLQSGRFCETVGFLSVNMTTQSLDSRDRYFRSYIDFNLELFSHHSQQSAESFETDEGNAVKELIDRTRKELQLDTVLGHVNSSNYYMDYVPLSHPKSLFRLLTQKVLPLLEPANPNITVHDERLIIINTGSVRYDLYKGEYTVDTHYIISPFQNDWVKVSLPKHVAIQIAPKLNENSYILSSYLRPPHQRYSGSEKRDQVPMSYPWLPIDEEVGRLTKGYVTYDEFGHDGDDTLHKAVINHPVPNVVQSQEFKHTGGDVLVDVVFYSFIAPNVKWALGELHHPMPEVEFYSGHYLGLLLNDYVGSQQI